MGGEDLPTTDDLRHGDCPVGPPVVNCFCTVGHHDEVLAALLEVHLAVLIVSTHRELVGRGIWGINWFPAVLHCVNLVGQLKMEMRVCHLTRGSCRALIAEISLFGLVTEVADFAFIAVLNDVICSCI